MTNNFQNMLIYLLIAILITGCSIAGTQIFSIENYKRIDMQTKDKQSQLKGANNETLIAPKTTSSVLDTDLGVKQTKQIESEAQSI